MTLHLDPAFYPGDIVIEASGDGSGERYIQQMTLGGQPLKSYRISHDALVKGKTLRLQLGQKR